MWRLSVAVTLLLLLPVVPCLGAEGFVPAWSTPLAGPSAVAVDPTDGSCWAAGTSEVARLHRNGNQLITPVGGFDSPRSLSVYPAGGSCWVADSGHDEVVHLASDGTELLRLPGFSSPWSVSVNPNDGTFWVAEEFSYAITHRAADGSVISRTGGAQPGRAGPGPVGILALARGGRPAGPDRGRDDHPLWPSRAGAARAADPAREQGLPLAPARGARPLPQEPPADRPQWS